MIEGKKQNKQLTEVRNTNEQTTNINNIDEKNALLINGIITQRSKWNVKASAFSLNTLNPIRAIVEHLQIEPNPDKELIPLSVGKCSNFFFSDVCCWFGLFLLFSL